MGRIRNIGRLRAGGVFSLASLFPSGAAGIWYSSDIASGFQDSARTTALTASGDPVGSRSDKSGNALHALQATAGSRPIYTSASGVEYDLHDGTDDGLATAAFVAGTLTSNMDFFCAIKRSSAAKFVLAFGHTGAYYFAGVESGSASVNYANAGTPTYFVNESAVDATFGALHTALVPGDWAILEVRNLNQSAWGALSMGKYVAYPFAGQLGTRIICPAQTDTVRAQVRRVLAAEVGI